MGVGTPHPYYGQLWMYHSFIWCKNEKALCALFSVCFSHWRHTESFVNSNLDDDTKYGYKTPIKTVSNIASLLSGRSTAPLGHSTRLGVGKLCGVDHTQLPHTTTAVGMRQSHAVSPVHSQQVGRALGCPQYRLLLLYTTVHSVHLTLFKAQESR
eukprot:gene24358-200_t